MSICTIYHRPKRTYYVNRKISITDYHSQKHNDIITHLYYIVNIILYLVYEDLHIMFVILRFCEDCHAFAGRSGGLCSEILCQSTLSYFAPFYYRKTLGYE